MRSVLLDSTNLNDIQPTVPIRPMCFVIHRKTAGDDTIFIHGWAGGGCALPFYDTDRQKNDFKTRLTFLVFCNGTGPQVQGEGGLSPEEPEFQYFPKQCRSSETPCWVLMILKFVVACSDSTAKNLEFDQFWGEVCRSLGEWSDQEVAG